jgi:multidrug transporter EmrE-like cation transporter
MSAGPSFGAVTLASVMTFRQFLSVVISCFLFGQPLSAVQWVGVLMVLAPVAQRQGLTLVHYSPHLSRFHH